MNPAPLRRLLRRAFDTAWRWQNQEPVGDSLRAIPERSPYDCWLERTAPELPLFEGILIRDVRGVALRPWPAMGEGVTGLYVRLADYQMTDALILELPPGGSTPRRRHVFEMGLYILTGSGQTVLEPEGRPPIRLDWSERSLSSVPLNTPYRLVNRGAAPLRLLAVTSFPFVINATDSEPFIFSNSFGFDDRLPTTGPRLDATRTGVWSTAVDLVPDALAWPLEPNEHRGPGATNVSWEMFGNTMLSAHASEIPAGRHKKAHRHSSDAFILLLSGRGYSVTWPDGGYDKRIRVDWDDGTLFVPPTYWYHQHFNPGFEPARYVAISARGLTKNLGLRFSDQLESDLPELAAEWRRELLAVEK